MSKSKALFIDINGTWHYAGNSSKKSDFALDMFPDMSDTIPYVRRDIIDSLTKGESLKDYKDYFLRKGRVLDIVFPGRWVNKEFKGSIIQSLNKCTISNHEEESWLNHFEFTGGGNLYHRFLIGTLDARLLNNTVIYTGDFTFDLTARWNDNIDVN